MIRLLWLLLLPLIGASEFQHYMKLVDDLPVVSTKLGPIQGSITSSRWTQRPIYQFRGIPFAQPPIGALRFKPPVPVEPWKEILDGTQFGRICPCFLGGQLNPNEAYKNYTDTGVEEDCLFLNVYTPSLTTISDLPVMFYIHGGGFSMRSSKEFRPELLLEKDIILVVPQYRLGPLGFLSADIPDAPGNAGLLDILLALQWVRDNIESFGGDPQQVTIFGQSAGAGISTLMLFSPLVENDLFQRVIFQSGSALGSWILDENPIDSTIEIAELADCTGLNIESRVACMKKLSYIDLFKAHSKMLFTRSMKGESTFGGISPVVQHSGSHMFLTEDPRVSFLNERFLKKPVLAGVVAHEASYIIGDLYPLLSFQSADFLKHNLTRLFLKLGGVKDRTGFMEHSLKEKFFKEYELGNLTLMTKGLIDLASSMYLKACTFTLAQEMSFFNPSYFYSLNYAGRYSKIGYGKPVSYPFPTGVAHSDDLLYLFPHETMIMNDEESLISKQMVDFWTSFAIHGIPESKGSDILWGPITSEIGPYLRIKNKSSMRKNFFKEYTITIDEGLPPGPIIPVE